MPRHFHYQCQEQAITYKINNSERLEWVLTEGVLNEDLFSGKVLCEGHHEEWGGEVEDEPEGDGDGKSWQSLLEDGQHDQRQAETL